MIKEISIKDMEGISIGHAQNNEAKTGVSVLYFENGARVGCNISGGGPASRETPLTDSLTADNKINAIALSGGSAYGLAASDGIMKCLEENKIGYDTGYAMVPLVCQSCIYDLGYGRSDVRPDAAMGYEACKNAMLECDTRMGNIGAGIGATVGKMLGMKQASKSGLGIYAMQVGKLQVAAVVCVNAVGDIFNPENGQKISGMLNEQRTEYADLLQAFMNIMSTPKDMFKTNTTIGCVICNADLDKAQMNKVAKMATNAYARCINPVATMADGDSLYACSIGKEICDINLVGTLSSLAMEKAIINAVNNSKIPDEEYLKNCL